MKALDDYFNAKKLVHEYFGYAQDWVEIPLSDQRDAFWRIEDDTLHYADSEDDLKNEEGEYYTASIWHQRFLPKWVYPGADFTLVCVDTHCDGNKYLYVLSNANERQ